MVLRGGDVFTIARWFGACVKESSFDCENGLVVADRSGTAIHQFQTNLPSFNRSIIVLLGRDEQGSARNEIKFENQSHRGLQ